MTKDQAAVRKAFCALLVFCQLGFTLAAAFPGVLLCHRANGRAVLETATPFGCACQECEQCLERRLHPDAERAARTAFEACHCQHDRLTFEPGSSSGLVPKRVAAVPPALFVVAAGLPGAPALAFGDAVAAFEARRFAPGPPGLSPLRC